MLLRYAMLPYNNKRNIKDNHFFINVRQYTHSYVLFYIIASKISLSAKPPSQTLLSSIILSLEIFHRPDTIRLFTKVFSVLFVSSFNNEDPCSNPTTTDASVSSHRAWAVHKPSSVGPFFTTLDKYSHILFRGAALVLESITSDNVDFSFDSTPKSNLSLVLVQRHQSNYQQ